MQFPTRYVMTGNFELHSGGKTNIFYDVNAALTDRVYLEKIINTIPKDDVTYVGIATGGAIIASHLAPFAMIKDSKLKGDVSGDYCLIDDVCTTEGSLREAIKIIGREPKYIFAVVDRRKEKKLKISSVYSP